MKPQDIIKQHLPGIKIMQLATAVNGQPYLCTVHYYSDDNLNFYWSSKPFRRHSGKIERNPKVSAYVLLHENTPEEPHVVGLTIIGEAKLTGPKIDKSIVEGYASKHGTAAAFVDSILNDDGPDKFYHLKPTKFILFDTKNFPSDPRQEWKANN